MENICHEIIVQGKNSIRQQAIEKEAGSCDRCPGTDRTALSCHPDLCFSGSPTGKELSDGSLVLHHRSTGFRLCLYQNDLIPFNERIVNLWNFTEHLDVPLSLSSKFPE